MTDPPRDPPAETAAERRLRRRGRRRLAHPPASLPRRLRVFLLVAGWIFLLVGLAGLALPGIQGVVTIVAGLALLSVASETAYWTMRAMFRRWPRGWKRVERVRRWLYRRVTYGRGVHGMGRVGEALERWERRLVAQVRGSWRLLPLHLVTAMLVIAAVMEPLVYERILWASKLPLLALLALALVLRRGRRRRAAARGGDDGDDYDETVVGA